MEKYLIEIHAHTDETSNCGRMPAAEAVRLFNSLGYNGIMFTDHLHSYTFKKLLKKNPNATWNDKIDYFLVGYKNALKEAKKIPGFKVYLGCELRFDENDNDYLVFGLSEDKLRKMKNICQYETADGLKFVQKLGCTIIQAHPFRDDMTIIEPGIVDGIEIHNAHPGHDSRNDVARMWADKFDYKIRTSGSDFHGEYLPNSGIYTDVLPENETELQKIIKENRFTLNLCDERKDLP